MTNTMDKLHNLFHHGSSHPNSHTIHTKNPHGKERKADYEFADSTIGEGGYSTVVLAKWKTRGGALVAIKVVRKEAIKNVPEYLKIVDGGFDRIRSCEQVCSPMDWFESSSKYYLTFPLLSGGELLSRLNQRGRYTESATKKVMRVMLKTLDFIHSKGIIHRDVKPDNFLYRTEGSEVDDFLLIDFGISKVLDVQSDHDSLDQSEIAGTPGYQAPEVFARTGYGKNADIFGVGVIAYNLLSASSPWLSKDYVKLIQETMMVKPEFRPRQWQGISDEAKDFVSYLMTRDPTYRPNAVQALQHPWLHSSAPIRTTTSTSSTPHDEHHDLAGSPPGTAADQIPRPPTLKPEDPLARQMTAVGLEGLEGYDASGGARS